MSTRSVPAVWRRGCLASWRTGFGSCCLQMVMRDHAGKWHPAAYLPQHLWSIGSMGVTVVRRLFSLYWALHLRKGGWYVSPLGWPGFNMAPPSRLWQRYFLGCQFKMVGMRTAGISTLWGMALTLSDRRILSQKATKGQVGSHLFSSEVTEDLQESRVCTHFVSRPESGWFRHCGPAGLCCSHSALSLECESSYQSYVNG